MKITHQDTSFGSSNSGPPELSGSAQADRPFTTFGTIRLVDFDAYGMYNGMQVHFQHRLAAGLELTTSYSWSHILDSGGSDINGGGSSSQGMTPNLPNGREWATGSTDQRNYLTLAFVWDVPKFNGGDRAVRAVVNGWGFDSIYQYISGTPLNVKQSQDGEVNGNGNERPDLVVGQPVLIPRGKRTIAEWFNTAAFTEAKGHFGNTPRDVMTGPKKDPLALSVRRTFPMPIEGQRLEFRVEAFNVLNHPVWAIRDQSRVQHLRQDILDLARQPRYAVGSEILLLISDVEAVNLVQSTSWTRWPNLRAHLTGGP